LEEIMAKETFKEFMKSLRSFTSDVTKEVTNEWNKSTLLGANMSRSAAPVDTGRLVNSLSIIKAVATPTGIKSSYRFNVDYAAIVNIIHKTKKRYAEKGMKVSEGELMRDVMNALGKVWRR
jgi:hypothetical protein